MIIATSIARAAKLVEPASLLPGGGWCSIRQKKFLGGLGMRRALLAGLVLALASTTMATAQSPRAFKASKNAFGQPELGGYWTNATMTPLARPAEFGDRLVMTPEEVKAVEGQGAEQMARSNVNTDPNLPAPPRGSTVGGYNAGWMEPGLHIMRVRGQPRSSLLTTPDGQVPLRKGQAPPAAGRGGGGGGGSFRRGFTVDEFGAAAIGEGGGAGVRDNPEQRGLADRCLSSFGRNAVPPMLPNGFYNNNYQIVQARDHVVINVEQVHDNRVIPLNAKHRTDGIRPWFGDSIGWYEGDTLVVETTHIPQRQAYNGSWENLKVTERFTRTAPDRLLYQFTLDDPTMWEKPWGGEYEFADLKGLVFEYACHEGNYALEGILAGARNEERVAAQAAGAR